jgi:hypothetical protein
MTRAICDRLRDELVFLNATFWESIDSDRQTCYAPIHSHWSIWPLSPSCLTSAKPLTGSQNTIWHSIQCADLPPRKSSCSLCPVKVNLGLKTIGEHNTPCSQVYIGKTAWSLCVPPTALSNVHLPLFHHPPLPISGVLNLQAGTQKWKNMPFRVGCHNPN